MVRRGFVQGPKFWAICQAVRSPWAKGLRPTQMSPHSENTVVRWSYTNEHEGLSQQNGGDQQDMGGFNCLIIENLSLPIEW
jgi:hypothetical protein